LLKEVPVEEPPLFVRVDVKETGEPTVATAGEVAEAVRSGVGEHFAVATVLETTPL
jgi:hypothetical protein